MRPALPLLRVRLLTPLVQPGDSARVAVSYVGGALVKVTINFPHQPPVWRYATTGSHGHLTLALQVPHHVPLHGGRASALVHVRAMAGPWHNLTVLSSLVRPGATKHITISYAPQTPLRTLVTFPGVRPLQLFDVTDKFGHLQLSVTVPRSVRVHHGLAVAHVAVAALVARRRAESARVLTISDMLVRLVPGPIAHCQQLQTVAVRYHPKTPLRIVLLFPSHDRLARTVRTDGQGRAMLQVHIAYVKAPRSVHIGVQVFDARLHVQRMEQAAVTVALPRACQASTGKA